MTSVKNHNKMANLPSKQDYIKSIAKAGFITKGILYCLIGILAVLAAFSLGGQSSQGNTDKKGVMQMVERQFGGKLLLGAIALGLVCYATWRAIQAFADTEQKGTKLKGLLVRARYLFSGLAYGSVAWLAFKILTNNEGGDSGKSSKQDMIQTLLSKPFGQWMVGIVALVIAGVGIYQAYYGLSEKFKKHVDKQVSAMKRKLVLTTGKVGYLARGIVWLLIGILFARAAIFSSSSEAGDTSKAFKFLNDSAYGSYLVAFVGLGLIFYGIFNLIRARYERFELN